MTDALQCAVCHKMVAAHDQDEHLRSNHLGPHYFRLNGRPYRTTRPSMKSVDLKNALDLPGNSYLWEIRNGKEIDYDDYAGIDLTQQPQLFLHFHQLPKRLQDPRGPVEPMPI